MRNSTPIGYARRKTYASPQGYRGYQDATNGIPYPAAYETWEAAEQRNYEKGRLFALELRHAGTHKPWRGDPEKRPLAIRKAIDALLSQGVVVFPLPKHCQPNA